MDSIDHSKWAVAWIGPALFLVLATVQPPAVQAQTAGCHCYVTHKYYVNDPDLPGGG